MHLLGGVVTCWTHVDNPSGVINRAKERHIVRRITGRTRIVLMRVAMFKTIRGEVDWVSVCRPEAVVELFLTGG